MGGWVSRKWVKNVECWGLEGGDLNGGLRCVWWLLASKGFGWKGCGAPQLLTLMP